MAARRDTSSDDIERSNIEIIFKQIPKGMPNPSTDFEIKRGTINLAKVELQPNQLLIRTLYLSVDPYMRARLRDESIKAYFPAMPLNRPVTGGSIAEVIKSTDPDFEAGDVVIGFSSWTEYSILSTKLALVGQVKKIPNARSASVPLSYYLGVLGMPGCSAYIGLHKICKPFKAGQTIYVSGAAGAVGHIVGQYAKTLGLRVVGSAGDDTKVDYLLNDLKFDAAFNYKKHDLTSILKETCPNGIDIYFENVGGQMLDGVLTNCNDFARIAVCGMISQYNRIEDREPIYNITEVIGKRIKMEGFIVSDDAAMWPECLKTFTSLLSEGKLKTTEHVTEGIEKAPEAFIGMLQGKNTGKAIVRVASL